MYAFISILCACEMREDMLKLVAHLDVFGMHTFIPIAVWKYVSQVSKQVIQHSIQYGWRTLNQMKY